MDLDPVALVQLRAALLGEEPDLSDLLIAALARDAAPKAGPPGARPGGRPRPVAVLSAAGARLVEMHRARILVAADHYGAGGLAAIAAGGRAIGVPLW